MGIPTLYSFDSSTTVKRGHKKYAYKPLPPKRGIPISTKCDIPLWGTTALHAPTVYQRTRELYPTMHFNIHGNEIQHHKTLVACMYILNTMQ